MQQATHPPATAAGTMDKPRSIDLAAATIRAAVAAAGGRQAVADAMCVTVWQVTYWQRAPGAIPAASVPLLASLTHGVFTPADIERARMTGVRHRAFEAAAKAQQRLRDEMAKTAALGGLAVDPVSGNLVPASVLDVTI